MTEAELYEPQLLALEDETPPEVAYFSMEIGLSPDIPTYSGGLGVLAGDALRAAADLGRRMMGVTLVYHEGYVEQHLDADGGQTEGARTWEPWQQLELLKVRAQILIEGRTVTVQAWRTKIEGITGKLTSAIFLDTRLEENSEFDRALTDHLYAQDAHYRLCQEVVLGLGGMAIIEELGWHGEVVHHMNEGHPSLLALALLKRRLREHPGEDLTTAVEWVRSQCIFTTHTPVPAGFDRYDASLARQVLGDEDADLLSRTGCCLDSELNLAYVALRFSRYINGVALRHGEVSAGMFPDYPIHSITNGVHAVRWASQPFAELFDRHVPTWRLDNSFLRYAIGIPLPEIQAAHRAAKAAMLAEVQRQTGLALSPDAITLGFARRATAYKRPDLLFTDLDRLRRIAQVGPLQIVYAGIAHPSDQEGKEMIRRVFAAAKALSGQVAVVYLQGYDMRLGGLLTSGTDLWLNTPQPPREASGTSGMKAALNGVPSLSILDGWWLEGWVEGMTGWAIGRDDAAHDDAAADAESLYDKLEHVIVPMYTRQPDEYASVMRRAISLNGSFFNTQRMMTEYQITAYDPAHEVRRQHQAAQPTPA